MARSSAVVAEMTTRLAEAERGVAYTQAGCGVVYDSVPALEYEETLNKAKALLGAIRQAEETSLQGAGYVTAHR